MLRNVTTSTSRTQPRANAPRAVIPLRYFFNVAVTKLSRAWSRERTLALTEAQNIITQSTNFSAPTRGSVNVPSFTVTNVTIKGDKTPMVRCANLANHLASVSAP